MGPVTPLCIGLFLFSTGAGFDRYKLVVQVVIGEQRGQGVKWVYCTINKVRYTAAYCSLSMNFIKCGVKSVTFLTFPTLDFQNVIQVFLGCRHRQLCGRFIHECKCFLFCSVGIGGKAVFSFFFFHLCVLPHRTACFAWRQFLEAITTEDERMDNRCLRWKAVRWTSATSNVLWM